MLFAALISGVMQAITGGAPGSVASQLPPSMRLIWTLTMAFGAGLALLGIFWKDGAVGMVMEASGLAFVAVSVISYSVAIVAFLGAETIGAGGIYAALTSLAFGGACFWRRRQLVHAMNAAIKAAE